MDTSKVQPVSRIMDGGQTPSLLQYSPEGVLIGVNFENAAEAKLAIKRLKLKKKEFQLKKREVTAQIASIRAEHRSRKTARGPKPRGSGFLMGTLRAVDTIARYSDALNVDQAVSALESQENAIDGNVAELERVILQLEQYIFQNS